jgi:hypothetical protein
MYIVLEYFAYVLVAVTVGAAFFGVLTLVLLSQEGAKHLAHKSHKLAERAIQFAADTARSTSAFSPTGPNANR